MNILNIDGEPYLSKNWILKNIMKLTDEEIELNNFKK